MKHSMQMRQATNSMTSVSQSLTTKKQYKKQAKNTQDYNKSHLVSGYVEHSGREHAKLVLKGWFKAIPNTSTRSFTITGDVD